MYLWVPHVLIVVAIGALSCIRPPAYFWFAFNHAAFLPLAGVIVWTLVALLAIPLGARLPVRSAARARQILLIAAVSALVSLPLLRTQFPGIQGDGDAGGNPTIHTSTDLSAYPDSAGRLHSFLTESLETLTGRRVRLAYQYSNLLEQDYASQDASILVTLLTGALVVVAITAWVWRRLAPTTRVGVQLLLFTAPVMLGAYGHFDSYIVPALCVVLWLIAFRATLRRPRPPVAPAGLAVASLLAAWSHPLLAVLPGFALVFGCWRLVRSATARSRLAATRAGRWLITPPLGLVIAAGVVGGLAPCMLPGIRSDNMLPETCRWLPDFLLPDVAGMRGAVLHEKISSTLQAGLPAYVLAAIVVWRRARDMRHLTVVRAMAVFMGTFTTTLMLTLRIGYGIVDEFIYAMLGLVVLAASVLLALATRLDRRVLVTTGLLSLYLFVPRLLLNAGTPSVARLSAFQPHDPCWVNRELSAYWCVSLPQPLNTAFFREQRLRLLEQGIREPVAWWSNYDYRTRALALYTAWCAAFEDEERGKKAIAALVTLNPFYLRGTWELPGIYGTGRYNPRAPWISRAWSERVFDDMDRDLGTNAPPQLAEARRTLAEVRRVEPPTYVFDRSEDPPLARAVYPSGYRTGRDWRAGDSRPRDRVALESAAETLRRQSDLADAPRKVYYAWRLGLFDGYYGEAPILPVADAPASPGATPP